MSESNSKPLKYCRVCQCETERNKHSQCKPCINVRSKAWKLANPDRVKETRAAWLEKKSELFYENRKAWLISNKEQLSKKNKEYKLAHKDDEKARYLAWAAKNPESAKERSIKWRANNQDRAKENRNRWRSQNKEAVKVHNQTRRARRQGSGGVLSKGLSEKLFVLQRGKCACCGKPLGEKYHMDHIMPLALGGSNTDDNMQLLRSSCNTKKHAKHPVDYMQSRGFLL